MIAGASHGQPAEWEQALDCPVHPLPAGAVHDLAHAIRLTREYVGADVLPAFPGWEWYDALAEHAPHVLAEAVRNDPPRGTEPKSSDLPWAKPFRRRCTARLEPTSNGEYWGRCDLSPHSRDMDHALERGLEVVRFTTDSRIEMAR